MFIKKILKIFGLHYILLYSMASLSAAPAPVSSSNGMVVSAQYLATEVGSAILNAGGNAVDAAVAVGYALAVVWPCCGNIGGGGFMLIHLESGKNVFIDFRETSPSELTYKKFYNAKLSKKQSAVNYLATGIPGTVLGLNTALEKYGTMNSSQVMAPAIKLAKEGFPITPSFIDKISYHLDVFQSKKNLSNIFLENKKLGAPGSLLQQLSLSKTLEEISRDGSKVFYEGNIAQNIVSDNELHGGVITLEDLKNYHVKLREPITCQYHGYTIVTGTPPSSGVTLCEILKLVEGHDLSLMGFHSSSSIIKNIEAMNFAYIDRENLLGSYPRSVNNITKILSDENIRKFNESVGEGVASENSADISLSENGERLQTTHYSIADKWGNAVSVTYSLNGYFGNLEMPKDTGFFMNNQMLDFSSSGSGPNSLIPNARPLSSMSPTIILKNNQLKYVLGTPGGQTIITQLVEVVENLIDYHMNISEAINACRYHIGDAGTIYEEPDCFSNDTVNNLNQAGYKIIRGFPIYHEEYWGGVAGIAFNHLTHEYQGAMDVRRPDGMAK